MKYWLDTEFIEGFHKPFLGKRRHFIDLISVALVAEDGREYSAISREYNYNKADDWVKENVILPLYRKQIPGIKEICDDDSFHRLVGKSNKEIAREIFDFVNPDLAFPAFSYNNSELKDRNTKIHKHFEAHNVIGINNYYYAQPTFIGYFSSYDWVLFCSLFGRMIDLPHGFPMFPIDVKQMMEERGLDGKWKDENCPEPQNAHDALADARWNKKLYEMVQNTLSNPINA